MSPFKFLCTHLAVEKKKKSEPLSYFLTFAVGALQQGSILDALQIQSELQGYMCKLNKTKSPFVLC